MHNFTELIHGNLGKGESVKWHGVTKRIRQTKLVTRLYLHTYTRTSFHISHILIVEI